MLFFKKILLIFLASFFLVIACSSNANNSVSEQEVLANHQYFQYTGRVDFTNPQAPIFSYPVTSCRFNFSGTILKLKMSEDNWGANNYVGVYLDNNPQPIVIQLDSDNQENIYEVSHNLEDTEHQALLVKRNDYITGEFEFQGIIIDSDQKILPSSPPPKRKIEVYGDSITAGYAVEYELAGKPDPEGKLNPISNAYLSYGAMLARDYQADISLVAQSGISLIDGYGYWHEGTGMEAIFDRLKPLKDSPDWNFSNYIPNLVIIALGQNDSSTIKINEDLTSREWKQHYKNFLTNLRNQYPEAYFICMFPNMYHNSDWDTYLTESVDEYKSATQDSRVYSLIHTQVTPGHPRESEQRAMADTLENFINNTLVNNGFTW